MYLFDSSLNDSHNIKLLILVSVNFFVCLHYLLCLHQEKLLSHTFNQCPEQLTTRQFMQVCSSLSNESNLGLYYLLLLAQIT